MAGKSHHKHSSDSPGIIELSYHAARHPESRRKLILAVGAALSFAWLCMLKLSDHKMSDGLNIIANYASSSARFHPTIYTEIQQMPPIQSTGPNDIDPEIGGVYEFGNVCLTKHHSASSLQGLIYLQPGKKKILKNNKRCIPCSAPLDQKGGWWGKKPEGDDEVVGHLCGFEGTHALFATDVSDWSDCIQSDEAQEQLDIWDQYQVPSRVDTIHYYNEPVYSLNFMHNNIGHSLFDQLLTWIPHWYKYRSNKNKFPFRGVVSHSIEGCLDNRNTDWFCEILRAMEAFGNARELPPEPTDTTLYCYKSLTMSHIAWQRHLERNGLVTKEQFDVFRDILFEKFSLPRQRTFHDDEPSRSQKILFYAHEPSGRRVWNNMNDLIQRFESQKKYENLEFEVVYDFGGLSTKEQAYIFNSADVLVMSHGAQMANSIFAVDDTLFIELGCYIPTFIGNPKFLALLDGRYTSFEQCDEDAEDDELCVVCEDDGDETYSNFTMTVDAFKLLIDAVVDEE